MTLRLGDFEVAEDLLGEELVDFSVPGH